MWFLLRNKALVPEEGLSSAVHCAASAPAQAQSCSGWSWIKADPWLPQLQQGQLQVAAAEWAVLLDAGSELSPHEAPTGILGPFP